MALSVIQKARGDPGEPVPVVMLTHSAQEAQLRSALEQIDRLADVRAPTCLVRIEEEA